jgi:hypothetical protein
MSQNYEKPTVTYLGQLEETPAAGTAAYKPGDYVWANDTAGGSVRHLAVIDSAHSIRSHAGVRWLVRLRRVSGWTSGSRHLFIERALTPDEVALQRRLGLVPPAGERP